MGQDRTIACLLAVLVVFAGVPATASATLGGSAAQAAQTSNTTQDAQPTNSTVNVTVGQQLSTVISATSDDVQSEVEATGFELEYENGSDEVRAEVVAERGGELRDRADDIRDEYEDASESYEAGALTKSEYAQRIATLNARAENVVAGYERLEARSTNVSKLELRAAGLNQTALKRSVDNLDSVRGIGAAALLQRFTGTDTGEIELETAGGLSVEVAGEDGEFSREINHDRDDDTSLTVAQSTALETARGELSSPTNASWTLRKASVHEDSGYYKFEFGFETADRVGESEVRVDGSSGEVFRVEEEVEPTDEAEEAREDAEDARGDVEDDREADEDDRELALLVADGTVAANETITVQALQAGEPVANVAVSLNGEPVGTTGVDGTVAVTLPSSGDVELTAGEGELEFELREDEDELYRNLRADATLDNGTVTVTVTYEDSGVGNATVYANDAQVATTGGDGTAAFAVPDGAEELDVAVVKGEFEAEFEYELRNGTLTQTDGADAGEDDVDEDDAGEDGADEDDVDEDDADEDDVDEDDAGEDDADEDDVDEDDAGEDDADEDDVDEDDEEDTEEDDVEAETEVDTDDEEETEEGDD